MLAILVSLGLGWKWEGVAADQMLELGGIGGFKDLLGKSKRFFGFFILEKIERDDALILQLFGHRSGFVEC